MDNEKYIGETQSPDSAPEIQNFDRKKSIHTAPLDATPKSRWERSWPTIACGSGLFSDGYLNGYVCLSLHSAHYLHVEQCDRFREHHAQNPLHYRVHRVERTEKRFQYCFCWNSCWSARLRLSLRPLVSQQCPAAIHGHSDRFRRARCWFLWWRYSQRHLCRAHRISFPPRYWYWRRIPCWFRGMCRVDWRVEEWSSKQVVYLLHQLRDRYGLRRLGIGADDCGPCHWREPPTGCMAYMSWSRGHSTSQPVVAANQAKGTRRVSLPCSISEQQLTRTDTTDRR